MNRGKSIKK
jgi:ASC-1-like (ASCH) protein